jgi:hypothetical protein
MSIFAKADRWLIEKLFEPIAHRVERETGVTNFALANALLVLWPATTGALAMKYQSTGWWFLAAGVLLISAVRYLWVVYLANTAGSRTANIDKLASFGWRVMQSANAVVFVSASLLLFSLSLSELGTIALWASLYFAACDRPPPQRQEQREPKALPEAA